MTFSAKLAGAVERNNSLLCVGLDPVPGRLPEGLPRDASGVAEFNRQLVAATCDVACAYKPNFAFYGALGAAGFEALAQTIEAVPDHVPVIFDAKVGDIDSTAERYAHMIFDELGTDAVTVNPYMGGDTVAPLLGRADRCVFLVCLTSNPGAADFELLESSGRPLCEHVAERAATWDEQFEGECGLVVGATKPESMARIRALAPSLPFLVPGVGAQGGDLEGAVTAGLRGDGAGLLINASRSITYVSAGKDFAAAAAEAARELRDQINQYRGVAQSG
ncbi:MAG: orotidine-5'-phosphate decarboxylase [Candidatus Latescibacterota bacterium]|nr:orotidine-5'-phosphate decarboxylase [Candidatus Latescibacterota bacterium]